MADILDVPELRPCIWKLTVAEYQRLGQVGLIDRNTELLQGIVVHKMNKTPLHTSTVRKLQKWLANQIGGDAFIQKEDPLTMGNSEPEPDLAVIHGTERDFDERHPTTADWVIEVAVTTLAVDAAKADIYSSAGVPKYWLVIPAARTIRVHEGIQDGTYRVVRDHVFGSDDAVDNSVTDALDLLFRS